MKGVSFAVLALTASLVHPGHASPLAIRALNCHDVKIPVTISANNANIPTTINLTDTSSLLSLVGSTVFDNLVQGTFNIAGRYCEPSVQVSANRSNTLQVLVHGIAFDKDYWSGLGPPGQGYQGDKYSWVATAAAQGYPTLAIDRLGNGQSDHPNGFTNVQLFSEIETTHGVLQAARNGKIPGVSTKFSKIVLAGHSYGSLVSNALSAKYPADADALILTGFTNQLKQALPGVFITAGLAPGDIVNPARFGTLDPSYLVATSESGFRYLAYGPTGGYDEALFQLSYAVSATVTAGEGFSLFFSQVKAPQYTGPVFVIDGKQDGIFCSTTATVVSPKDCGSGDTSLPSMVRVLYPAASRFDYLIEPNTGHVLHLHYTAPSMFQSAHSWLAARGF